MNESHTGLPRSREQVQWILGRQGRRGPSDEEAVSLHELLPQYTLLSQAPPSQRKEQAVQPKAVGLITLLNQITLQRQ